MINILSKETIDKIAAGEVAESPESVLKELLDNSVDAGADTVSVEIRGGGLNLIRITDNGCGIYKDDIRKAFMRHATSKIKEADDLSHVLTMGFRGEALNSIAAVSKVELITKPAEEPFGILYRIEGGEEKLIQEVGVPDGTTLAVKDFLYNVPVRRQFLKSPQTEGARLISMVECMALAHPDVSISLKSDGKMILETPGNGRLKDVLYIIFGSELSSNLVELKYERDGLSLSGYIAKPVASRSRRDREIFFVNNRYIRSNVITKAVEDAYAPYLMQHRFPSVFINILTSPESVDVNVHPKKTEIRFSDDSLIYNILTDAIKEAITSTELIIDAGAKNDSKAPRYGYSCSRSDQNNAKKTDSSRDDDRNSDNANDQNDGKAINQVKSIERGRYSYQSEFSGNADISTDASADVNVDIDADTVPEERPDHDGQNLLTINPLRKDPLISEPFEKAKRAEYINNIKGSVSEQYAENSFREDNSPYGQSRIFLNADNTPYFNIVGQVFNTYWIIEFNDEMYMIDQHAAHEKVNYERYMKKIKNRSVESQMLLPPIIIRPGARESVLLSQNTALFEEFGYEIEEAGDRDFIVRAVPSNLPDIGDRRLLEDLIGNIFEEGKSLNSEVLKDRVASISCKKAIKGGQKLTEQEIKSLIAELLTLDNPYSCPHGRPTIIKWSRSQIEKLFKRIV